MRPAAASQPDALDHAASMGWLGRRMDLRADTDSTARRSGPLAGLPYCAKDLFDIEGEPTVAASPTRLGVPAAVRDAVMVARLRDAGAVLLGTTNMDSLAYGFVSSTRLYGTARNPHDPDRICGGSSGGSAAMVAAGIVPFSIGTDTSGSIRVPSALCGVPGLKPGYGMLDKAGVLPLAPSLDHCGLFADSLDRLQAVYGVLAGNADGGEPVHAERFGLLEGYFDEGMEPAVRDAIREAAASVRAQPIDCPGIRARAAAYITVAAEAARTHAHDLRARRSEFDPAVRDRLTAGLLIPAAWLAEAAAVRRDYLARLERMFEHFDVLFAPAVPCLAPSVEDVEGGAKSVKLPLRASLGLYTQPLSLTGLPVLTLPLRTRAGLPTAIQLVGARGRETLLFAAARQIADACPLASHSLLENPAQDWRPS